MTYTYDTSVSCLKRGNNLIPGRVSVKCVPRSGTSFKRMLLTQSPPCRGPTYLGSHVRSCALVQYSTANHSKLLRFRLWKSEQTPKLKYGVSLTPINVSQWELFPFSKSLLARLKATASLLKICLLGSRQLQVSFLARIRAPQILTVVLSANS